jgi:SAM-dependent methyltransferase
MPGFDAIAPVYDALSWPLGPGAIAGVQRDLLGALPACARAVVVGGGTGRIAVDLIEGGAASRIVYLEPSRGMIARARRRAAARGVSHRIDFRRAGVEGIEAGERFDLVVTPFVLDLFAPVTLEVVMDRLDAGLVPGGAWLFADFVLDRAGPLGRATVPALYAFFRAVCRIEARRLPDFDAVFARRGFRVVAESRRAGGLLAARLLARL